MSPATSTVTAQREPGLVGQTVVVIGGSSGIGLETARRARAAGASVILTGRNPERLSRAAVDSTRGAPRPSTPAPVVTSFGSYSLRHRARRARSTLARDGVGTRTLSRRVGHRGGTRCVRRLWCRRERSVPPSAWGRSD
jgi:NAD(P)-dependent dehydrogenase (short-subunit alcohol dehydrogenase family)